MAELVDASDSKSGISNDVQVRFLFWALDLQYFTKGRFSGLFSFASNLPVIFYGGKFRDTKSLFLQKYFRRNRDKSERMVIFLNMDAVPGSVYPLEYLPMLNQMGPASTAQ